jgi:hypothetical protein
MGVQSASSARRASFDEEVTTTERQASIVGAAETFASRRDIRAGRCRTPRAATEFEAALERYRAALALSATTGRRCVSSSALAVSAPI